ncbi:hypothetical protein H0H92_005874 [Tricholoma furcatifolium]|nr:hypothetical protein H0H92_005874 [Tricholoma furcatifolium]
MTVRAASDDLNPRPSKRLRHESSPFPSQNATFSLQKCMTDVSTTTTHSAFRRMPPASLLLALPSLLTHPSNHRLYLQSLWLARHSLRRCLGLPSLEPVEECRAWTGIAELGLMWLETGVSGFSVGEVEQAITKAAWCLMAIFGTMQLVISNRHPALRLYTPHLTILSARLAQRHQSNSKFAAHTLRRLLTSLDGSTTTSASNVPPHISFNTHIELIHSLACTAEDENMRPESTGSSFGKCLAAVQAMQIAASALDSNASENEPNLVVLFTLVLKLQLLIRHGVWNSVSDALTEAEKAFDAYDARIHPVHKDPSSQGLSINETEANDPGPTVCSVGSGGQSLSPVPGTLRTHLLILGVLFHTYAGDAQAATERLRTLHALLDTGILESKSPKKDGSLDDDIIEIPFPIPHTYPLRIRITPARILHAVAFLLSAVAKRDAVGRAPKKGVFAKAGLELRELMGPFGGTGQGRRLARIKADLFGEVIAINIMRSEFPAAQSTLDQLTAFVRSEDIFDAYAARITLQHAQLAHAQGNTERARRCYEVAACVAKESRSGSTDEWVLCAAKAGELWVRVGVLRLAAAQRDQCDEEVLQSRCEREMFALRKEGTALAKECESRGAALHAVGELLRACLAEEFLVGKQHLRRALDLATSAQDNHLRALILALSASHYLHTARDHALTMLSACAQLAAGLGAVAKGEKAKTSAASMGNAPLGLWVGERVVELHRLAGDTALAERQESVNEKMRDALSQLAIK